MRIARLLVVVSAAAFGAASLPATGRAGTECVGVPSCISVPGPWVVVPRHGEVTYLLECPGRKGVVGGLDAQLTSQDIRVTFDGLLASPISAGHTTGTYAFFRAVSGSGKGGAFEPRIGCIPQKTQPVDTSWRVVSKRVEAAARPAPRPAPLGAPLDLAATTIVIRPGTVQTTSLGCLHGEHLVSSWHATVFTTAEPPDPGLSAVVHVLHMTRNGKVTVTIRTTNALPAAAKAAVQVGVKCAPR